MRVNRDILREIIREVVLEAGETESQPQPDLLAYRKELISQIFNLLFTPAVIEYLHEMPETGEWDDPDVHLKLDVEKLFADYESISEATLVIRLNDSHSAEMRAYYLCDFEDRSRSSLVVDINAPSGYDKIDEFKGWLEVELVDSLAHELQHSCDPTEILTADIPAEEEKWETPENILGHFASEAETRGNVAGIMARAEHINKDVDDVLDSVIDQIFAQSVEAGHDQASIVPVVRKIWTRWYNRIHPEEEETNTGIEKED